MSRSDLWGRRGLIAAMVIVLCVFLTGCAGTRATHPEVPEQSMLNPATQALDKAIKAQADQFAPRIVDSARRRITIARDILFNAAKANRPLSDAERDRVHTLVDQAKLDARAAKIKAQAKAVQQQIAQLQGNNGASQQSDGGGGPTDADQESGSNTAGEAQ